MFSSLDDEKLPANAQGIDDWERGDEKTYDDTNSNRNESPHLSRNADLYRIQPEPDSSRRHRPTRDGHGRQGTSTTSRKLSTAVPKHVEVPAPSHQGRRSSTGVVPSPQSSASKRFLFEQFSKSLSSLLENETGVAPSIEQLQQSQTRRPTAIASMSPERRALAQGRGPHPPTGDTDGKCSSATNLHTVDLSTEIESKNFVANVGLRPSGPRRGSVDTDASSCSESSLSATWWPSFRRKSSLTGSASLHCSSRRESPSSASLYVSNRKGSIDSAIATIQQTWHSAEVVNSKVMREAKMVIEDGDMLRDFQTQLKANGTTTGMATKAQLQEFMAKRAAADNNTLPSDKSDRPSMRRSILHNKTALSELLPILKEDDSINSSSSSDGPTWIDIVNKRAKEIKALIKKQVGEQERGGASEEEAQKRSERQRLAEIALVLARLYSDIGLTRRSVAVIDEALALWTFDRSSSHDDKELVGGFTEEEVEAFHETDLHSIIQLKIEESKVLATQASYENGSRDQVKCIIDALAIFQHFSSTVDVSRYRSVKFPIYSVLFLYIKTGRIQQENRKYFMTQVSDDFVTDATLHGDPVHLSRAIAMRAEVCSNFGKLEEAINTVETLRRVYDVKLSNQICKAYGSDRSAQCFSMVALWLMETNDLEGSFKACEYVLTEILPKSDPTNVHNSVCLLYPIIVVFKNMGEEPAARVNKLFQLHVLDPFHEHFKDGGVTPTLSLFKPLTLLLNLCTDEEEFGWRSDVSSIVKWAASEDGGAIPEFIDSALENFGLSPTTIVAELCLRLSKLAETPLDMQDKLLVKSKMLALRVREKLRGRSESVAHRIAYRENERVCEELDLSPTRSTIQELDGVLKRSQAQNVEPDGPQVEGLQLAKAQEKKTHPCTRLLEEIFPPHVAAALREGRKVEPETFDMVTIFFSDIKGFTTLAAEMSPRKVSDMLDRLYTKFDDLSHKHGVNKLETIGDAWMGLTNLFQPCPEDHVKRVALFSIDAIKAANETLVDYDDISKGFVEIRVGFHSGPVLASVVGSRRPKYSVFGDTVNTSSRMESNSLPMRIQCSDRSAGLLRTQAPEIKVESRGVINVKGKGRMETFWVGDG